ncbi:hypothetical protein [Cystobacter fuscus]|uniref:hypothetical protein n=1 Tax=Cystobacter fuscus TaxID=43 RepID=UPI002B2E3083|nr:hypothetical protein F0U63_34960 [Cystobacter fuscus]
MSKKTGLWLVISTLAGVALGAAPAMAEQDQDPCYEELYYCIDQANQEPEDWIRDYSIQLCYSFFNTCMDISHPGGT